MLAIVITPHGALDITPSTWKAFLVAREEVLEVFFEVFSRLGKIYTTHTMAFWIGRFAFGGVLGYF